MSGSFASLENNAFLDEQQLFTKAQGIDFVVLTDQAVISADLSLSNIFQVTLGGNRTLTATNLFEGSFTFLIYQDGTGSRTLTFDSMFNFPNDLAPVLQTDANTLDIISCISDGTNLYCSYITSPDFVLPSNVALLDTTQSFTALQTFSSGSTHSDTTIFNEDVILETQTLTDGATVSADLSSGNLFTVTLGGNRTLTATNISSSFYKFIIKQDATGSRALTFDSMFDFGGLAAPTLQTTANAVDVISCVGDGSSLRCAYENRGFLESLPSNVALKDTAQQFTARQGVDEVVVTFANPFTTDLSLSNSFEITLTGDTTWNFNNATSGTYTLTVKQDATGGRTLTPGTNIVIAENNIPDTTANYVNVYSCIYDDNSTKLRCVISPFSS